jgi:hypothetical protein
MLGSYPGLLRLRHWQSVALTIRLDPIHIWLDLIHKLDLYREDNVTCPFFMNKSRLRIFTNCIRETELYARYTRLRKIGNWRLRRVEGSLVPGSRDRKRLTSNHPGWCGSGRARGRGLYCLLSLSLSPPPSPRRGGGASPVDTFPQLSAPSIILQLLILRREF